MNVTVRRRKAYAFRDSGACDHEGTQTVFGQIFQQMKKNGSKSSECFRVNEVDRQVMEVKFMGEGSVDRGGPYRDTLTNMC